MNAVDKVLKSIVESARNSDLPYPKFDKYENFRSDLDRAILEFNKIPENHKQKFLEDWLDNRDFYDRLDNDVDDDRTIYEKGNQPKSDTRNGLLIFWTGLNSYRKNPDRYIS